MTKKLTKLGMLLDAYYKATREDDDHSTRQTAAWVEANHAEKVLMAAITDGNERKIRTVAQVYRLASDRYKVIREEAPPIITAKREAKDALFAELLKRAK